MDPVPARSDRHPVRRRSSSVDLAPRDRRSYHPVPVIRIFHRTASRSVDRSTEYRPAARSAPEDIPWLDLWVPDIPR